MWIQAQKPSTGKTFYYSRLVVNLQVETFLRRFGVTYCAIVPTRDKTHVPTRSLGSISTNVVYYKSAVVKLLPVLGFWAWKHIH